MADGEYDAGARPFATFVVVPFAARLPLYDPHNFQKAWDVDVLGVVVAMVLARRRLWLVGTLVRPVAGLAVVPPVVKFAGV